jgi:hypothetical protein
MNPDVDTLDPVNVPVTVNPVRLPTLVMLGCADVVTVPAKLEIFAEFAMFAVFAVLACVAEFARLAIFAASARLAVCAINADCVFGAPVIIPAVVCAPVAELEYVTSVIEQLITVAFETR